MAATTKKGAATQTGSARRAQVASACKSCRGSKVKCSGKHPTCTRCESRGELCEYDVMEEGMTKRESLRHELSDRAGKLERMTAVFRVLQTGTDQQATELLARIRMGVSVEDAYDQLFGASQQTRRPSITSDTPPSESIDPALMDVDIPRRSSMMPRDSGLAVPTLNALADGEAGEDNNIINQSASRLYNVEGGGWETAAMDGSEWANPYAYSPQVYGSEVYSPVSTCSMADVDRTAEQPNIDPELQRSQPRAPVDQPGFYGTGSGFGGYPLWPDRQPDGRP